MTFSVADKLKGSLHNTSGVYVPPGVDEDSYFSGLREDIISHMCDPFAVSAKVSPPAFPDVEVGDEVSGICVAHKDGYWLVYTSEKDTFYCFWGTDVAHLSAPGIFGGALYCWTA
jgi:hypothetical protein